MHYYGANCIIHRMGRHGLRNFSVLREGCVSWQRDPLAPPAQTGSSISRCRSREIILLGESDCEARGLHGLRQGCQPSTSTRHLPHYKTTRRYHGRIRRQPQPGYNTDAGKAGQRRPAAIVTVAEQHSPSMPFLVSKWVGAQALTGQDGQPKRGSSATTCSPRLLERVKDGR